MTWFQCSHTDHKVAKIRPQSASQRKTPPLMDHQNSSYEEVSRCPTPAARHAICARGHWKNRWLQSSSTLLHNGHTTAASGLKQRLRVRVIMRPLSNSNPNKRIFSGSGCFHTNRLWHTSWGSSGVSSLQRRRYTTRTEKLRLRYTHLSLAPSDGRNSSSRDCRDSRSASIWSDSVCGRDGVHASNHCARTVASGFCASTYSRGNISRKRPTPDQLSCQNLYLVSSPT